MSLWYRLQQFRQDLLAGPLTPAAWEMVTAVLTEREQQLFRQFLHSDQWHSVRVAMTLQNAGHDQPDLLAAALLHDVGKTRVALSVLDRSLIVLVQKLFPPRVAVWGSGEPVGWKRPFVVKMQHPAWGAQMAAAAGSSPSVIALIRRHQDELHDIKNEVDQMLFHLKWADDQN